MIEITFLQNIITNLNQDLIALTHATRVKFISVQASSNQHCVILELIVRLKLLLFDLVTGRKDLLCTVIYAGAHTYILKCALRTLSSILKDRKAVIVTV